MESSEGGFKKEGRGKGGKKSRRPKLDYIPLLSMLLRGGKGERKIQKRERREERRGGGDQSSKVSFPLHKNRKMTGKREGLEGGDKGGRKREGSGFRTSF